MRLLPVSPRPEAPNPFAVPGRSVLSIIGFVGMILSLLAAEFSLALSWPPLWLCLVMMVVGFLAYCLGERLCKAELAKMASVRRLRRAMEGARNPTQTDKLSEDGGDSVDAEGSKCVRTG